MVDESIEMSLKLWLALVTKFSANGGQFLMEGKICTATEPCLLS